MKCPNCGKEISKEWLSREKSCQNCGADLKTSKGKLVKVVKKTKEKPSAGWYLVALYGMLVGGIIGYRRVKDRDERMAKILLILGTATTIAAAVELVLLHYGVFKIF